MAMPKRGARLVEYDGQEFLWRIRKKPTYVQGVYSSPMTISVQKADSPSPKVLLVTLNVSRPDNWIAGHQTQITPRMIKMMINGALADGWNPDDGGSVFAWKYYVIKDA